MRQPIVLCLFFAAYAAAHVPIFSEISSSLFRIVDAPKTAMVSQVLYGKLLPGQELCLRAEEQSKTYYEIDFTSSDAETFQGGLGFSVICDGDVDHVRRLLPECTSGIEGHAEIFTQSLYYSVAQSPCGANFTNNNITTGGSPLMFRVTCPHDRGVRACMHVPPSARGVTLGAIIIGRDEEFSLNDLFSFPIYTARLHGSYGNRDYVFHYITAGMMGVGAFAVIVRGAPSGDTPDEGMVSAILWMAAGVFLLVAIDTCYHATKVASDLSLSAGGLRFAHTRFAEPGYCDLLFVLFFGLAVDASLFIMGTETAKLAVVASVASTAILATAMVCMQRRAALLAVILGHLCLGLLFFLGSGCWVGPSLLAVALSISLIWSNEQWWPHRCPCDRHSVEIQEQSVL